MRKITHSLISTMETTNTMPNFFNQWLESQKKIVDTFTQSSSDFQKNWNVMNPTANPVAAAATNPQDAYGQMYQQWANNWMQQNQQMTNNSWNEWLQKSYQPIQSMWNISPSTTSWFNTNSTPTNWVAMNEWWMNQFQNITTTPLHTPNTTDMFSQLFAGKQHQAQLAALYAPIWEAMQKDMSWDKIKETLHTENYKKMIDNMFGWLQPSNLQQGFDWINNLAKSTNNPFLGNQSTEWQAWWNTTYPHISQGLHGDMSSFSAMQKQNMETWNNSMSPFMKLVNDPKEKQKLEIIQELLQNYTTYSSKLVEIQKISYTTAQKAWEDVTKTAYENLKDGKQYADFNDFYKEWSTVNEKLFIETFRTEEYAKLQNELVNNSLDMKQLVSSWLELNFANYPVALRSEMNELYQIIHDLRNEVRSLKKDNEKKNNASVVASVKEVVTVTPSPEPTPVVAAAPSKKK